MAKIPLSLQALQKLPFEAREIIVAAILGSDDEMFIITDQNLARAKMYKLITAVNETGDGAVIIAEPK